MPNKGNKCCCCPEKCVATGTVDDDCSFCGALGTPLFWQVQFLNGTMDCCCAVFLATHILYNDHDDADGDCEWTLLGSETPQSCGNITPPCDGFSNYDYLWRLTLIGTDPGDATLKIEMSLLGVSQGVVVYKNLVDWRCRCTNVMTRDDDLTTFDVCTAPKTVCVIPFDPCCPDRAEPMPTTLIATFTEVNDCPCVDGGTINLDWDEDAGRWIGEGPYGTCVDEFDEPIIVHIELVCPFTVPPTQTCDSYLFTDLSWPGGCSGTLTPVLDATFDCSCEPFHIRSEVFSTDGCCDGTMAASQIRIDITEP